MSKQVKKLGIAFNKATPALVKQVEAVIADAKRHTFSVSKVYAAYNAVFELNERPQTCASCLQNRADKLAKWYNKAPEVKVVDLKPAAPAPDQELVFVNEAGELSGEPTHPVTYIVVDGEEHFATEDDGTTIALVNFTPAEEGAQYGKATERDGSPAPAYVYKQNDIAYMVSDDEGNYTVVTGEPIADVTPAPAEEVAAPAEEVAAPAEEVAAPAPAPAADFTVLTLKDETAQPVHFTTKDCVKGTVKNADGTNVKTGTHELADGRKLAVAVAGKAAIKA